MLAGDLGARQRHWTRELRGAAAIEDRARREYSGGQLADLLLDRGTEEGGAYVRSRRRTPSRPTSSPQFCGAREPGARHGVRGHRGSRGLRRGAIAIAAHHRRPRGNAPRAHLGWPRGSTRRQEPKRLSSGSRALRVEKGARCARVYAPYARGRDGRGASVRAPSSSASEPSPRRHHHRAGKNASAWRTSFRAPTVERSPKRPGHGPLTGR